FGRKFTGILAYLMWGFIHVLYLIGWGNRLGTMYTWMRSLYLSKNRGHRVITVELAHHRVEEGRARSGRPSPILPRKLEKGALASAPEPSEQTSSATDPARK